MHRRRPIHLLFSTSLPHRLLVGALSLSLISSLACKSSSESKEDCVDNLEYFRDQVWAPVMSQKCITCHNSTGAAKNSRLILVTDAWGPDYLEKNYEVVEEVAKTRYEGLSWLIAKPSQGHGIEGGLSHGGDLQLEANSDDYKAFEGLVARIDSPVLCDDKDEESADVFFEDVELLDPVATLRKASLSLVGRLPTRGESQRAADNGIEGLESVLDELMEEDAFYDRLKEIYNDHFLVDRYLPRTDAIDLLDLEDHPTAYWFDELSSENQAEIAADYSNEAITREALELIAYVVREEKPFTEILTANYTVVNPYSAKVYGLDVSFDDENDPREFVEAKISGRPHAGVLTTPMFLTRFPTTETNRNRHRSRMLYKFFLGTDVLRLAERPIDASDIKTLNPTRNDPNCVICHATIDPVAGTLQNWDDQGRYRPLEDGWYGEMFLPGFNDEDMPNDGSEGARWLAKKFAEDRRFSVATIHILFTGLSGQEALRQPSDPNAENFLPATRAFEVQQKIFAEIGDKFAEDDFNLKTVIKEIIKSPYYRAANAAQDLDEERKLELAEIGTGRLLTPEQLHRKIESITGYPWRRRVGDSDFLLTDNWYRIYYGGIDSDTTVQRITEPNGIMANVAERMGNEVACWVTARDFLLDPPERRLFPYVGTDYEPEDGNGFEVPAAADAIRANIQYLHKHLLGEFLEFDDPELVRTYNLFLEVWRDGKKGMALEDEEQRYANFLPYQCQANEDFFTEVPYADELRLREDRNYTIRAWMAVLSYLLADYRFLHE